MAYLKDIPVMRWEVAAIVELADRLIEGMNNENIILFNQYVRENSGRRYLYPMMQNLKGKADSKRIEGMAREVNTLDEQSEGLLNSYLWDCFQFGVPGPPPPPPPNGNAND